MEPNNKDEILNLILGYRDSAVLFNQNQYIPSLTYESIKKMWPRLASDLISLSHYIRYQAFNYKLYSKLASVEKERLVNGHSDLPLRDYVLGLVERNRFVWKGEDMERVLDFAKNKVVVDFGYGGGFYADYFSKVAKKVYGIEKPDVAEFVSNTVTMPPNFVDIEDLSDLPCKVDIIWVSEVFHGDSVADIQKLVTIFKQHLKAGGKLYINELMPGTILSKHFDTHMKIHTNSGRLYRPGEWVNIINWKTCKIRTYKYHYIVGGKI